MGYEQYDQFERLLGEAEEIGENYAKKRMTELEAQILTTGETVQYEDALGLVEEMNSWTSFLCGDNERLFRAYQYHAVLGPDKKVRFIQGLDLKR